MRTGIGLIAGLILLPTLVFAEPTGSTIKWPEPPKQSKKDQSINNSKTSLNQHGPESAQPQDDEFSVVVLPEVTTEIHLSSSDINRIVCPTEIKDVVYSKEKGLNVKITGKDAFVKFVVLKKPDGDKAYSVMPTEMFVVCGEDTFQLIVWPRPSKARTVRLTTGKDKKIKANQEMYSGLPFEKRIIKAIKDVFTENAPDSFAVTRFDKRVGRFKEVDIIHRRSFDIEGEGLRVLEYEITLKEGIKQFKLNEKLFIKKEFAENPVALSLEKHVLRTGDMSRLFIVEQRQEKMSGLRGGGDQLPSIEHVSGAAPTQSAQPVQQTLTQPVMPQKDVPGGVM